MASALPSSGGPDFEDWLSAQDGSLQRTAHLLTGSAHAGQELVQNTLARLYRRWDRIRGMDDVDHEGLRVLVDESRTAWRRPGRRPGGHGDRLVELVHDEHGAGTPSYDESHEAVWDFICSLPPEQRTVVVLRFHDQLTDAEITDLTRTSVDTVTSGVSGVLASLRAALPEHPALTDQPTSAEPLLTRTLTKVVESPDYPTTWTSAVAPRSRALLRARR